MAKKKTTKKSAKTTNPRRKAPARPNKWSSPIELPSHDLDEEGIPDLSTFAVVDSVLGEIGGLGNPFSVPSEDQRKTLKVRPKGFLDRPELWIFALRCLQMRLRKSQIRRHLQEFIEHLGYESRLPNTAFENILERARVELRAETDLTSADHVALGYENMIQILSDPSAEPGDKIKAQQVINELLGIGAKYNKPEDTAESKVALIRELLSNDDAGE